MLRWFVGHSLGDQHMRKDTKDQTTFVANGGSIKMHAASPVLRLLGTTLLFNYFFYSLPLFSGFSCLTPNFALSR